MSDAPLARTLVRDLAAGVRARVCGWFAEPGGLRDHTGVVELLGDVGEPAPESAIEVIGTVEGGDSGPRLLVERLAVVGPAARPLPLAPGAPLEQRLDWRYLDLREPRNRLIFAVQTTAERAMRAFWADHGYIEIHSPKLRPIPNKSGDQLFPVEYFGRRAYLAQSPQFYKQMAMAAGFERVFEIAPVFRAQADATPRHAAEFVSVDVEMSWIASLEDVLSSEERLLCAVIDAVRREHGEEIARRFGVELRVPAVPFPRVTLEQAREVVAATGWDVGSPGEDLDPEGERRLSAHVAREHGHEMVFVVDYPEPARPFYHMRCREGSIETRSFDLLWKGLEITSGAQREHRYDRLVAQAEARQLPTHALRQYLEFFKFGCPPHGGFGLGLGRMLMSMLGLDDLREATYLFRGPDRVTP